MVHGAIQRLQDGKCDRRAEGVQKMKLSKLKASSYRSLRDESIEFKDLNLFIGPNASGKSTILDALHFLQEGIQDRDFREAVASRGGISHLAWKGNLRSQ